MAENQSYAASGPSGHESRPLSEGGNGNVHGAARQSHGPMNVSMPMPMAVPAETMGQPMQHAYAPVENEPTGRVGGDWFVLATFALGMVC